MKDIMWPRGRTDDGPGGLEFIQASDTDIEPLMRIGWSEFKDAIVASLTEQPTRVSVFYEDWVCRPDDMYCRKAYRQALIELEEEGRIEVLGKDGSTPTPAASRRKWKGQITMPENNYVRRGAG